MAKETETIEKLIGGSVLLDDSLMTRVFDGNSEAAEILLQAILKRKDLKVVTAVTQKAMPGAKLDIYAEDEAGDHYEIEVQRARKGSDIKRARYYSAVLDARMLRTGQDFKDMMDSFVIFITGDD